jgi:hypothetical protein
MNKREIIELGELLERIDRLIKEYMRASIPAHLAFLEAEITAAKEKLQRVASLLSMDRSTTVPHLGLGV